MFPISFTKALTYHASSCPSHIRAIFEGTNLHSPMLVQCYILRSSLTLTSRHLAISIKFSKLGCVLLVGHLDTVAWSTPICSANHLLVRFYSASITFSRFKSLPSLLYILLFIILGTKIVIIQKKWLCFDKKYEHRGKNIFLLTNSCLYLSILSLCYNTIEA